MIGTAAIASGPDHSVTASERELLSAVISYAESPFSSMTGLISMDRGLTYPDVDDGSWPTPFAQAGSDSNVLVPGSSGPRYEAMDPPVRSRLIGYHWMKAPDLLARSTIITRAVNCLPKTLAALGDLQRQDPTRFQAFMGTAIPSVQMGGRWMELRDRATFASHSYRSPLPCSRTEKIGSSTDIPSQQRNRQPLTPMSAFCTQCGTSRPGGRFCGTCGTRLGALS